MLVPSLSRDYRCLVHSLHMQSRREAEMLIISLQGRLDGNSARHFESFVSTELQPADKSLVLEIAALNFISSAGLRELMVLAKKFRRKGAVLSIIGTQPLVRETLQMTGMAGMFHFCDNPSELLRKPGLGFLAGWLNWKS